MAARPTVKPDGRRSSGIDRRTIKPALLVLALAVTVTIPTVETPVGERQSWPVEAAATSR